MCRSSCERDRGRAGFTLIEVVVALEVPKRSETDAPVVGLPWTPKSADSGLPALEERSSRELDEKRLVAKVAADRIRDGEAILLQCTYWLDHNAHDPSTVAAEVARRLWKVSAQRRSSGK